MAADVELVFLEGRIERWIRFGRWVDERILDRRRRVVRFPTGAVFALVRWQAGPYGSALSRLDILRATPPGAPATLVPGVTPGGELFAHLSGWPRVERALQAIDRVEACGIAAHEACPDHWRHVGNRLEAGLAPRPYTAARHRAWLLRKTLST